MLPRVRRIRGSGLAARLAAALALAIAVAAPQVASAAGAGSFSPTGDMGSNRLLHASATLPDGRVMIFGGTVDGTAGGKLASTELFDPATRTFSSGPTMGVARAGPIAVALADGRVLVAGGNGPLSSAQVYNPATNSFSGTGFMGGGGREGAGAALLPDGRVLVVGGADGGGFTETAEIWDPATNLWTPTADDMARQRYAPAVAPLPDGRVLVVGGYGPALHNDAEIYDPGPGTFSSAGLGLVTPSFGHRGAAAAPLPDGRVLVAGGDQAGGDNLTLAEAFDPATLQFSPAGIGALGTPRGFTAAAALKDGRVLVTGGGTGSGVVKSAEIFAATNTFTHSVSGRKLLVQVQAKGRLDLAPGGKGKAAAAKKKVKSLVRPASAEGGPGTITIALRLTKPAKSKLRRAGKVKIPARITFSPVGGLPNTQAVKLKVKSGKKK
jgi:hypothetical protein